jgi:hypothetical protein
MLPQSASGIDGWLAAGLPTAQHWSQHDVRRFAVNTRRIPSQIIFFHASSRLLATHARHTPFYQRNKDSMNLAGKHVF